MVKMGQRLDELFEEIAGMAGCQGAPDGQSLGIPFAILWPALPAVAPYLVKKLQGRVASP